MKTRSSSGVGHKIDLSFNPDTMRICDSVDSDNSTTTSTKDLYSKISRTSNMGTSVVATTTPSEGPVSWQKPQAKEGFDLLKPNSGLKT
jgi:hypothetical protein